MTGRELFDGVSRTVYRRQPPGPTRLERYVRPSMEEFRQLRRLGRPALLDGLLEEWPHRDRLSLASLRERFGSRELPVLSTTGGRVECDVNQGVAFDTMRFADYVDRLAAGQRMDAYLASPMDTWLPELKDDLPPPRYCRDAPWVNPRLWLSAPGTTVPLHRDVAQNIFVQLAGRKRFLLYAPAASPWLYSHDFRSALPNYSRFDPDAPDYTRFPLSRDVRPLEIVLEAGDAIYLPSRWWHHVRTLDVSLSVAFWWADGAVALAVRAAEFVKRKRGFEIYGLEQRLGRQDSRTLPAHVARG